MQTNSPYTFALNTMRHAREGGDIVIYCIAEGGRHGLPDMMDMDVLAHFDCSEVVLTMRDYDCDGSSDSFMHFPGTIMWMDAERLVEQHGSEWHPIPYNDKLRACRWTDMRDLADAQDREPYRYMSDFHPAPWCEDDSLGTVYDHTNDFPVYNDADLELM